MRVPRSSRSKPPAGPATPSVSSSNLSRSLLRAAALCAPLAALAIYARSLWGSPAFGSLADQGYHLELGRAFAEAWQAGEFLPTWSATANGGLGSPAFVLYPPLFAFLTASWMRLLGPGADALRWAALSAAAFNLGAAYWAARARLAPPRAALAAGLALLLPGMTFVALGRGMFPNFLALGWVALAAGAAQRALDGERRGLALLTLAGAGLILTHTPSAYLAALLAAVFLLVRFHPRRLAGALLAGVAALALTAWFWVPMLQTSREAQKDYLREAHPYRESLWLGQGDGASAFEEDWAFLNEAAAAVGLAQALLAAALLRRRREDAEVLGGLSVVAAMAVAASVWPTGAWLTALPYYESVQFCWRWQPLLALWCAFAFAAIPVRFVLLPGCVLGITLALFAPLTFPLDQPAASRAGLASNLIEMRPLGAPRDRYPPGPPGLTEVVHGECRVTPLRVEPALREYRVHAKTPCTIRVRTFHFAGWTATLDGSPAPIEREPGTALQLVAIPAGGARLQLRYRISILLD